MDGSKESLKLITKWNKISILLITFSVNQNLDWKALLADFENDDFEIKLMLGKFEIQINLTGFIHQDTYIVFQRSTYLWKLLCAQ